MTTLENIDNFNVSNVVGNKVIIQGKSISELIDCYEKLLIESYRLKEDATINTDLIVRSCHAALEWLRTTDFYSAPASTRYHESVPGGLLVHTLNVYNNIIALKEVSQFSTVNVYSAALVALVHDWCKINYYESYKKNVKNDNGVWEEQIAYKVNQTGIPLGHGVSSMFLASRFFKLTPEEALAIRWHMGHFRVCDDEVNEFQRANEMCPLVHLIQFADQLAITNYANNLL